MDRNALTFAHATREHFAAIVRIERAAGGSSLVALTEGLALDEALQRGHYVTVALAGDAVAGWSWFSVDGSRGGEEIGQLFRVAVAPEHARSGIGRALVEHAQATLAARGCTRMRATLSGDDEATRAFLAAIGYEVDAVTMERPL
jgi:ribosomal protein S18 acetylase RimI-like enzyme